MEPKTKIKSEDGRQDLLITREFDLPVASLFRAYVEADIVEQWMGTKVLKLENKMHGGFQFVTTDPFGNEHQFNGAIHDFVVNQKIVRTFEMENTPMDVWLEFLDFESLSPDTSKLQMHLVFRTIALRDQMLQIPFAEGLNMAHDRLQELIGKKNG